MTQACVDGMEVLVYAVPDADCSSCDCGTCFGGNLVACDGAPCTGDASGGLLPFALPAGRSAVIYEFYAPATGTTPRMLTASACAQVTLDSNGTSSGTAEAPAMCCP